ncbi:MAG: hypothetical protein QHH01_00175 [Spirochaetales bacterium]|nr:hypothetical protein [Spirochaetales bacterium]
MRDPWPTGLRDRYEAGTLEETGARNVVSAIYLDYRAYDRAREVFAFMLLVLAFCSGMAAGRGFLANPFSQNDFQPVVFITLLNFVIGIKVGVSIGLLSIGMFTGDVNE